jgi:hypothetical protein
MDGIGPAGHNYSINDIRADWRLLDRDLFPGTEGIQLISHEPFTPVPGIKVTCIPPGRIATFFSGNSLAHSFFYAVKLFLSSDRQTVIIVNGGNAALWLLCGLINASGVLGKRNLLCWDLFVEYILGTEKSMRFLPFVKITTQRKEKLARFVMRQYGLNVLWSKKQVVTHAQHFNTPEHHFIFLPFKSNHSKTNSFDIAMGNFIFAGGNSKRDYKCLTDAVKGTGIPVIISATDPKVRQQIEQLPNIMVIGAPEPAFGQLQAAARLVVIPLQYSGLKGAGEANFCNAMWHGKPVIAADSLAAEDYIVEGETGFVVQSGDSLTLRNRIDTLWNDPELCRKMGLAGRKHVEENFTHAKFIRRLLRLALLYGAESTK